MGKSTFCFRGKSRATRIHEMQQRDILYIRDFCKFLFEMNATQTTKINLIKYTVVIFLASSGFIHLVFSSAVGK